jgi:hypothetical protein
MDWEVSFNGGIYNTEEPPVLQYYEVRARNRVTGKTFIGLPADFECLAKNLPLDSGNVAKTGAGVIYTSPDVSDRCYFRILNTHGSAAVTVDVSFDGGTTWTTGVDVKLQDGTYGASLAAGKMGILEGKFDKVRLSCSATSSGRLTSYTAAQVAGLGG